MLGKPLVFMECSASKGTSLDFNIFWLLKIPVKLLSSKRNYSCYMHFSAWTQKLGNSSSKSLQKR